MISILRLKSCTHSKTNIFFSRAFARTLCKYEISHFLNNHIVLKMKKMALPYSVLINQTQWDAEEIAKNIL